MSRLLRLVLVLMLVIPSLQARAYDPAPAATQHAGHEMVRHQAHVHGHKAPQPLPAVHHDCIGCIAPIDIRVYRPTEAPQAGNALVLRPAIMAFALARSAAPEPPPPRVPV